MSLLNTDDLILDIIKSHGPLTTKAILEFVKKKNVEVEKEYINSILYGYLREVVVRDRNIYHVPTWRLKTQRFEAAKGYESTLYKELVRAKVITSDEALLDYEVRHPRSRKTYHLDIAILKQGKKFNIEVDGFDHMRADARLSIQNQIKTRGLSCEIDIDWMDNTSSYVDFKKIDSTLVNKWCNRNPAWCTTYHEELIWPHDITRNIWLIENGWKVMRLWNMQINHDLKTCIQEIQEWIND
jgi:very-short-patch-repair endonuclease